MNKLLVFALALCAAQAGLLLDALAQQAVTKGQTNIQQAMPAVCLNPVTFAPESCGGGAAGGGLTDAELRATPVPISGTVTATGPLTDGQLRATPVPVSGTVTATGPLTDGQLRATPVPVTGTLTAVTTITNPVAVTGTFFQATQPVSATTLPLPTNAAQETGGNLEALAIKDFATSAKQDTGNTSLSSIDAKIPALVLAGQPVVVMASALPVPPVLPGPLNPLRYRAMMASYCKRILCPPLPGGLK